MMIVGKCPWCGKGASFGSSDGGGAVSVETANAKTRQRRYATANVIREV
jgi:hypothetical protein